MIPADAKRPLRRHWTLWLGALAAGVVIWLASICLGILHEASQQEIHSADAIVVFGAAEYSGRLLPSIAPASIMPSTYFSVALLRW